MKYLESVLLYGGTFDPIHVGHIGIAREVASTLNISKIILIPSARPPHKIANQISDFQDRLAMVQLATDNDPLFSVSDCEARRECPSYTLETVLEFRNLYPPPTTLYWLIGADTIRDLPDWYRVKDLLKTCIIVTARRLGCPDNYSSLSKVFSKAEIESLNRYIIDTPIFNVSSTEIRTKIKSGQPIAGLVPQSVERYIHHHKLYL